MPMPTVRDVHIDTALSNISIAYTNAAFIADQVFPVVGVNKKTDYYWVFPKAAWQRDEVAIRAPGTRAARADYDITTASYVAINYAIAKVVPDEVRDNADNPLRPDVEATEFVTSALLRALERRVANLTTGGSGLWAYSTTPTTQWSVDTSDPWGDIDAAMNGVISVTGAQPNVAVMSWDVWRHLRQHPDFLDRVKYTRPSGRVEVGDLRSWFGFDKVLIGNSLWDKAQEGVTASPLYIWGDQFWCGYVPATPSLMTPAAGYVLEWGNRTVRRYREDQEHQDVVEAMHYTDEVITASDSGAVLYNVV